MKHFVNTILTKKTLLFFLATSAIVLTAVKLFGDFPTYPPSIKKPIPWVEVFERFQFIFGTAFIITLFYVYGSYLDYVKNKNKK